MTIEEILCRPEEFRYMLLNRMQVDCEYYLTSKHPKFLWANNEYKQIEYMKAIWNSFPDDGKPEWLTMEQIENYEKKLTSWLGDTAREEIERIKPYYAGCLVFYYNGAWVKPNTVWFSCQIVGESMGGYGYIHYDNALRPVYIDHDTHRAPLYNRALRNVSCDCKDGYLYNFRRE